MEARKIHGRTLLAAALFLSSIFVMGIKLSNPTPIQIFIAGNQTAISQLPGFFTLSDTIILIVSSFILCAAGAYLLFFDSFHARGISRGPVGRLVLEDRKSKWEGLIKTLKNDEQKICKAIIDSDGIINQSELKEKTKLPKANVSRALDLLESRGLVERRRRGMGNVVMMR